MNASTPAFFDAVKARRSIYVLDDKPTTDDARIEQLATDALQYVPSAFNSQSTRLAVLLHGEHKKFWTTTKETLGQGMREEDAKKKLGRLDGFASAVGTILFFENDATVKESQKRNPAYASMFPNWSEHTSGMHQFVLWTALEAEGYGMFSSPSSVQLPGLSSINDKC